MRQRLLLAGLALTVPGAVAGAETPPRTLNGFAVEPADIPVREILPGGPGRDGIPALDHPEHAVAPTLWPDDALVMGVAWNGEARAYPLDILTWHELVNDTLGRRPILVSYCPLCGTGLVFDRRVGEGGRARSFGVSGLLYRSDLLMYDRETESLWSQISARAVTGPSRGARLGLVRARIVPWSRWRALHPDTTVLTRNTGHRRDYGASPYGDYAESERLLFEVARDRRYHPKMPTLGLRTTDGAARAYPAIEVVRAGGAIEERFAGHPESVEVVEGYWFAWAAFHPETSVAGAPPDLR